MWVEPVVGLVPIYRRDHAELKRRLNPEADEAHRACVVKSMQEDERLLAELRRKKLILRRKSQVASVFD